MMVALNPSPFNFDETNTTLKYANSVYYCVKLPSCSLCVLRSSEAKQIQNMAAKVAASPAQQIQVR